MFSEKDKIELFLNKRLTALLLMEKHNGYLSSCNRIEKEKIQKLLEDLSKNETYKLTYKTVETKSAKVLCNIKGNYV